MIRTIGIIQGHYECRSLQQTVPILQELLALEIVSHQPGQVTMKHPNMAMTEEFMRQEEVALGVVRAIVEGLHFFKTRREDSVRIMSEFLKGADIEALRLGWAPYAERIFPAKPYPSVKGTELVIREVATQNPAASKVTPDRLFDLRFIEKVDRSGFIDQLYR